METRLMNSEWVAIGDLYYRDATQNMLNIRSAIGDWSVSCRRDWSNCGVMDCHSFDILGNRQSACKHFYNWLLEQGRLGFPYKLYPPSKPAQDWRVSRANRHMIRYTCVSDQEDGWPVLEKWLDCHDPDRLVTARTFENHNSQNIIHMGMIDITVGE